MRRASVELFRHCKENVQEMNHTVPVSNGSGGFVSSEYPAPYSNGILIIVIIVFAAEIPTGLPANLNICLHLYKRKDLRKVPHILLWNLSFVGVLISTVYIPLFLAITVIVQFLRKPLHVGFGIVRYSCSVLFLGLQTLTLIAMAIDRHDAVVRPCKRRITATNVWKVVRGIWLFTGVTAVGVHLPLAINDVVNNSQVYNLRKTAPSFQVTLVLGNFYLIASIIVILTTFIRIVKKLRSSPFPESNARSEGRVTRLTYFLLFFYLISWLPVALLFGIGRLVGLNETKLEGVKILILALSNLFYVVNPFVHMNIVKASQRSLRAPRETALVTLQGEQQTQESSHGDAQESIQNSNSTN